MIQAVTRKLIDERLHHEAEREDYRANISEIGKQLDAKVYNVQGMNEEHFQPR